MSHSASVTGFHEEPPGQCRELLLMHAAPGRLVCALDAGVLMPSNRPGGACSPGQAGVLPGVGHSRQSGQVGMTLPICKQPACLCCRPTCLLLHAAQGKLVCALDVEHSGQRVVAGSKDYTVRIFDFNGMKTDMRSFRSLEPQDGHPVHALSWSPSGGAGQCPLAVHDLSCAPQRAAAEVAAPLCSSWRPPCAPGQRLTSGCLCQGPCRVYRL